MSYILVLKQPLVICYEMSIPVPMSHGIETRAAAAEWMIERGMQKECTVMPMSKFRALSGFLPEDSNVEHL